MQFQLLMNCFLEKSSVRELLAQEVSLELSCFVWYWVALGATETSSLEVFFSLVLCSKKLYICQFILVNVLFIFSVELPWTLFTLKIYTLQTFQGRKNQRGNRITGNRISSNFFPPPVCLLLKQIQSFYIFRLRASVLHPHKLCQLCL